MKKKKTASTDTNGNGRLLRNSIIERNFIEGYREAIDTLKADLKRLNDCWTLTRELFLSPVPHVLL